MPINLETYPGFDAAKVQAFFDGRGWSTEFLEVANVFLVPTDAGAALECGDGRFDLLEARELYGVRILGGINAVMALLTGGDKNGLLRATQLIREFGATPGTHSAEHGGCGYADLWIRGEFSSVKYPYNLNGIDKGSFKIGHWLKGLMKELGGKHFRLNGNHTEEAVRLNPFKGFTEHANDGLRFRIDDWFLANLGIPDKARWFNIAETIELLKPDATKLEIVV